MGVIAVGGFWMAFIQGRSTVADDPDGPRTAPLVAKPARG